MLCGSSRLRSGIIKGPYQLWSMNCNNNLPEKSYPLVGVVARLLWADKMLCGCMWALLHRWQFLRGIANPVQISWLRRSLTLGNNVLLLFSWRDIKPNCILHVVFALIISAALSLQLSLFFFKRTDVNIEYPTSQDENKLLLSVCNQLGNLDHCILCSLRGNCRRVLERL